jgi:hypothetical protein
LSDKTDRSPELEPPIRIGIVWLLFYLLLAIQSIGTELRSRSLNAATPPQASERLAAGR